MVEGVNAAKTLDEVALDVTTEGAPQSKADGFKGAQDRGAFPIVCHRQRFERRQQPGSACERAAPAAACVGGADED